jgi:hypothetical protein
VVKRRTVAVHVVSYRAYRFEVLDEVGTGWQVVLHPPTDSGAAREVLRTACPDGLAPLLAEARGRVEQLLATDTVRLRSG